ncbi:MAG TPA: hypothetical protein VIL37_19075 [Natronosporangium sp.]
MSTGAMASGATAWSWPAIVCRRAVGSSAASTSAALRMYGRGVSPPSATEAVEMPVEVVAPMRSVPSWPALAAMAHPIAYDVRVMGDFRLLARWRKLDPPTLVITGSQSAQWRQTAARAVAELVPAGQHLTVEGSSHDAPPELIGPLLRDFLSSARG